MFGIADTATSPLGARLRYQHRPTTPVGVVLVLHGGQAHSQEATSWRQASVLRVMPFAWSLASAGRGQLVVAFLRYAVRGWNTGGDPLRDARWALQEIGYRYPGLPVALVGYSMGGRVALQLAGECRAHAVVTLAAWFVPAEAATWQPCPGLRAFLMHGAADRVTDPRGSELAAQVLRAGGAATEVEIVSGATHTLLRQPLYWQSRVSAFVRTALRQG
ncbi:MAG: alpha/beta hydrolase [Ornithinimicrobium sp.]